MNIHNKIFNNIFQQNSYISKEAHARVNLIGEHTDYTGGYVLPCLLKYKTVVSIAKNKVSKKYNVYSDFFKEKISFNNFIKNKKNKWVDYLKGCLFIFYENNKNLENFYLNFLIQSTIPVGRGISSSSALCVAIIKSLYDFYNIKYSNQQIAKLAQKVEYEYIKVSGGIMDQFVSSVGVHGKAFFLDCLSLKYELIDIPKNYIFYLVDSQFQRNIRDSEYNKRYYQLKEAEKILKVKHLGRVKTNELEENKFQNPIIFKRSLHTITENQRVLDAKDSLLRSDMKRFGELMNISHTSYSKDFEASSKDIDILVNRSLECGALGCRLTGGGFGGFTVSLIAKKDYDNWYNKMLKFYTREKFFEV